MQSDPAARGLDHATAQAVDAVRGLVADSPVRLVADKLALLDQEAERAEQQANRWEQTANRLDNQRATHRAEDDVDTAALRMAEDEAARVRAEVTVPLTVQAEADGVAYLTVIDTEAATSARLATVGRFGRRKARAENQTATEQTRNVRLQAREVWGGEPPRSPEALPAWPTQAAAERAETDPRVSGADRDVEAAHAEQKTTRQRHQSERRALLVSEYGAEQARGTEFGMGAVNPHRTAADARRRAALVRAEADELRNLPVTDAARRIKAKRAEQEQTWQQAAQRARQLGDPFQHEPRRSDPGREPPSRGL